MKYWLKCLNLGICTSIKWIRNQNTPIHSYSYFSKIFSFSAWTCSQIQTVEEMKFQMVPMMKQKILMAEVLSMNMTMGGATESSACLHSETTPEHFYTTQFPQIYLWRCWHPVTNSPVLSFTVMLWSAIPGPTWRRSMQQFSAVIWEDWFLKLWFHRLYQSAKFIMHLKRQCHDFFLPYSRLQHFKRFLKLAWRYRLLSFIIAYLQYPQ